MPLKEYAVCEMCGNEKPIETIKVGVSGDKKQISNMIVIGNLDIQVELNPTEEFPSISKENVRFPVFFCSKRCLFGYLEKNLFI